jgi:hypothetical protein
MRLRIAGYEESACTTYCTLRKRFDSMFNHGISTGWYSPRLRMRIAPRRKVIGLTNNPKHGGIVEYVNCHSSVWRDAYWHRDRQWFGNRVWNLQEVENKLDNHDWNHVLESVCSLERTGRASSPDRSVSRRTRLNRGWTPIL